VSGEREQNWYPIGKVGWFSQRICEGIEVTAEQLGLLRPALAQPGRLDYATVARIIQVHQDQADDLMAFQNQAGRWNAVPRLTRPSAPAVREYEAAIGELRRLMPRCWPPARATDRTTVPLMMLPGAGRPGCSLAARHRSVSKPTVRTAAAAVKGLWVPKTCVTWADALESAVPCPVPGEPVSGRPDVR